MWLWLSTGEADELESWVWPSTLLELLFMCFGLLMFELALCQLQESLSTGKKKPNANDPTDCPKARSITEPKVSTPNPACQEDGEIEQCLCSQSAQASTGGSKFGHRHPRDTATSGNPPQALRYSGTLSGLQSIDGAFP